MIEGHPALAAQLLNGLDPARLEFLGGHGARLLIRGGVLELVMPAGEALSVSLEPSTGRPPLLRATLAGRQPAPSIADATAGMGADAFDLAWAGCRVTAIERSPLAWLLLKDGLRRAALVPRLAAAAGRIELKLGDALELLPLHGPFDVVYLDPMFDGGKKTAGKRKAMRLFHELGAADGADAELLQAARAAARLRAVVKRPARGEYLGSVTPSGSLKGRTIRFDLYAGTAAELE